VCRAHGIALERSGDTEYGWTLELAFADSQLRRLRLDVSRDARGKIVIANDGPWADATVEMASTLALVMTQLAERLAGEAIRFADFNALAEHIVERCHGERLESELAIVRPSLGEGEGVQIYPISVVGEPWIVFSMILAHEDDVDPHWALEKNAALAYASIAWVVALERFELNYSFPLMDLTGARFDELTVDLAMVWRGLRSDLQPSEDDDEAADDEDE
jgi:hypothetical protein